MKNVILILTMSLFSFMMTAQETKKSKNKKIEFHVDGNCEMCKKRIEKAAITVSGVKSANWKIETGTLNLLINEEKTTVNSIQNAIATVGHDNDGVKASDEAFEKLHTCCQYIRK